MASEVGWKLSSMLVWKKGIKRRVKKGEGWCSLERFWMHAQMIGGGTEKRATASARATDLLTLVMSCQQPLQLCFTYWSGVRFSFFFLVFSIGAEMLVWLCTDRAINHLIWELTLNVGCAYKKKETFSTLDGCILPAEKTAFQVCWSPGTHLYQ